MDSCQTKQCDLKVHKRVLKKWREIKVERFDKPWSLGVPCKFSHSGTASLIHISSTTVSEGAALHGSLVVKTTFALKWEQPVLWELLSP